MGLGSYSRSIGWGSPSAPERRAHRCAGAIATAVAIDADVVLLDVGLPDISGLEVARALNARLPQIAVVVTSTHESSDHRELALAHGARGFLPKAALTGPALDAVLATG